MEYARVVFRNANENYIVYKYNEYYDNLQCYMLNETEARTSLWAYHVVSLFDSKNCKDINIFYEYAKRYPILYDGYFIYTLDIILGISELEKYHEIISNIKSSYIEFIREKPTKIIEDII